MNDGWMAGILEGEGHFGTIKRKYQSKKKGLTLYEYPCITVVSTDEDVIRRLHEVAGCGYITGPRQPKYSGAKLVWSWRCAKRNDVHSIAARIRPYMLSRRTKAIEKMLNV